jgi:hypothetical protein
MLRTCANGVKDSSATPPFLRNVCWRSALCVLKNFTCGTVPLMKPSKMQRELRTTSEQNPAPPRLTHSEWYGSLCLWNPGSTCFPELLCPRIAHEGCSLVCEAGLFVCVCSFVGWLNGWLHTYAQNRVKVAKGEATLKAAARPQVAFKLTLV